MFRGINLLFAVAMCGMLAGCGRKPALPVVGTISKIGETADVISEEEARAFAEKYVDAVLRNDQAAIAMLIDWDTLAERSLDGVPLSGGARKTAKDELMKALTQEGGLIQRIHQQIGQRGSYKLLRVYEQDGRRRARVRMLPPEGGVNYHDLLLAKTPQGRIRVIDAHTFTTGQMWSEPLKRSLLQLASSQDRRLIDRLPHREQLMIKHIKDVEQLTEFIRAGNWAEALHVYHQLPAELQRDKSLLMLRLKAAQNIIDDHEYLQTLSDFRQFHTSDASIDFLSIDYFFFKKDFQSALKGIDAVDQAVGGDPYLSVMRGAMLIESGKYDEGERALQAAIDAEPDLRDAWWTLITLATKQQDYEKVLSRLKAMDARIPMDWTHLAETPGFEGFVQSPYYAQWLDYRSQPKDSPAAE